MNTWSERTLGDLVRLQRGHDLTAPEQLPGDVPVMGSAGPNGLHNRALAKGPGVVIGRSGASMGRVHFIETDYWPHNTCLYVTDFVGNNPRFVYYLLQTLDLAAHNSGSAQPSLNRNFIYSMPLMVPTRNVQDGIAQFIGALDDRISLLRETNMALEAIAQALFKSWFVDFDPVRAKSEGRAPEGMDEATAALFPNTFEDSPLGPIPSGWSVRPLRDFTTRITKGTTPTKDALSLALDSETQINYVRVNALATVRNINPEKLTSIPDSVHRVTLKRSILEPGDVLYTIAGTIGRSAIVEDWLLPANVNQAIAIIRPKPGVPSAFLALMVADDSFREHLHSNIVQAVQANLSLGVLAKAAVSAPKNSVLKAIFEPIDALISKVNTNRAQERNLNEVRDELLPRLISGQLRVADVDSGSVTC